tara:strand:- start:144 stop:395 length:252 start_codon:yes stop_codon:yes gene_type:complete
MKIRQELIDKLAGSDWTREKLAEEVLIARYHSKKNQLESHWLDQLATILRDGTDYIGQDRIYKEYEDALTDNMDIYRDRDNES